MTRKILGALLGLAVAAGTAYYLLFPRSTFFIAKVFGGGSLTFGWNSLSYDRPPVRYAANGTSHLGPYLARLAVPARGYKFLFLFTPDGQRGCGLTAVDNRISVSFALDRRTEAEREGKVRAFFASRGLRPCEDNLGGNGSNPVATRHLGYPLPGDFTALAALTQSILHELCGVSATETLDIDYREK